MYLVFILPWGKYGRSCFYTVLYDTTVKVLVRPSAYKSNIRLNFKAYLKVVGFEGKIEISIRATHSRNHDIQTLPNLDTTRFFLRAGEEACWDPYKLAIQSVLRESVPGTEG